MKLPIPHAKEDISARLVQDILRAKFPQVTVKSIKILKEILGTGAKFSLELDHAGADGLPRRMWLKTGLPGGHFEQLLSMSAYAREAQFYSELRPLLDVQVPECYGAVRDTESGRGVILLENLDRDDVTIPGCVRPQSVAAITSGLDLLSDLHGRSWEQEWLYDLGIPKFLARGTPTEAHIRAFPVEYLAEVLEGPVGAVVPSAARNARRAYDALWRLQPDYEQGPFCLVHGDAHPGNSYVNANGRIGLFDWQTYSMGPWVHDVTYWIVAGLSVGDRRKFERSLLNHYLTRLAERTGRSLDPGDAWDSYRRFMVYGYLIWLAVPPVMQPIENTIAICERYGAAIADHHVFELLGLERERETAPSPDGRR